LLPFKSYSSRVKEPLELIHNDVWGPVPILSPLILSTMFFSLMITSLECLARIPLSKMVELKGNTNM